MPPSHSVVGALPTTRAPGRCRPGCRAASPASSHHSGCNSRPGALLPTAAGARAGGGRKLHSSQGRTEARRNAWASTSSTSGEEGRSTAPPPPLRMESTLCFFKPNSKARVCADDKHGAWRELGQITPPLASAARQLYPNVSHWREHRSGMHGGCVGVHT